MLFPMSFSTDSPPAGWYPDPAGSGGQRYWDGGTWSQVSRGVDGAAAGQPAQPQTNYVPQGQAGTSYGTSGYGQSMSRQPVLAGFWWRVLASIIDFFILLFPLSFLQGIISGERMNGLNVWMESYIDSIANGTAPPVVPNEVIFAVLLSALVQFLVYGIYRTILVAKRGATLGQTICGLHVVPEDSPPDSIPSWRTSGVRAGLAVFMQYIPILNLINPLSMLISDKKQTLHDRLAGTVVLKK